MRVGLQVEYRTAQCACSSLHAQKIGWFLTRVKRGAKKIFAQADFQGKVGGRPDGVGVVGKTQTVQTAESDGQSPNSTNSANDTNSVNSTNDKK